MDLFVDTLLDSLLDTLQLIPFLFVTYFAMEWLEHAAGSKTEQAVSNAGKAGPLIGSLLGAIPQCGFSAMAATLYSARMVTVGTLVAVILSTSDEMLPIFVAAQQPPARLLSIMGIKIACGIIFGFAIDGIIRLICRGKEGDGCFHIHELCEREHCECDEESGAQEGTDDHSAHNKWWRITRSALIHTVRISLFVLVITFAFGLLIAAIGSDTVTSMAAYHPVRAVFATALIGLIPNCGASVAITELFLEGLLPTGSMLAGLLTAGGVGLLVLFRTNEHVKENLAIVLAIYLIGVLVGLAFSAAGITL